MDISAVQVWNGAERICHYFYVHWKKLEIGMAFCDLPGIFFTKRKIGKENGALLHLVFCQGNISFSGKRLVFLNQKIKPHMLISINID